MNFSRIRSSVPTDKHLSTPESSGFAARVVRLQIERERDEKLRQRARRIQAANDAVEAYMKSSGTRDYQNAFLHVRRTRPDLFANMHSPARGMIAENYNHNHDALGRFAFGSGAGGLARRVNRLDHLGQRRRGSTSNIADHAGFKNSGINDCVPVSFQTVAATLGVDSDRGKIDGYLNKATQGNINWRQGLITQTAAAEAGVMQSVLAQMGLQGDARYGKTKYPSTDALTADLKEKGTPAIANLITKDMGEAS